MFGSNGDPEGLKDTLEGTVRDYREPIW